MQSEMLPVERPLLSKQLELLDDVLAQGIAPHKDLLEDALPEVRDSASCPQHGPKLNFGKMASAGRHSTVDVAV